MTGNNDRERLCCMHSDCIFSSYLCFAVRLKLQISGIFGQGELDVPGFSVLTDTLLLLLIVSRYRLAESLAKVSWMFLVFQYLLTLVHFF